LLQKLDKVNTKLGNNIKEHKKEFWSFEKRADKALDDHDQWIEAMKLQIKELGQRKYAAAPAGESGEAVEGEGEPEADKKSQGEAEAEVKPQPEEKSVVAEEEVKSLAEEEKKS